jgi:hypothetical protein
MQCPCTQLVSAWLPNDLVRLTQDYFHHDVHDTAISDIHAVLDVGWWEERVQIGTSIVRGIPLYPPSYSISQIAYGEHHHVVWVHVVRDPDGVVRIYLRLDEQFMQRDLHYGYPAAGDFAKCLQWIKQVMYDWIEARQDDAKRIMTMTCDALWDQIVHDCEIVLFSRFHYNKSASDAAMWKPAYKLIELQRDGTLLSPQ